MDNVTASSAVTTVTPSPGLSVDASSLTFDGLADFSGSYMDDSAMIPGMPPPLFDAQATASLSLFTDFDASFFNEAPSDFLSSPSIPGLDFFQDYSHNQYSSSYGTLTPMGPVVLSPTLDDAAALSMLTTSPVLNLPAMPHADFDLDLPSAPVLANQGGTSSSGTNDATLPTTANATTGILDSTNSSPADPHATQSSGPPEDSYAPRRTTRPHVPSMREHVLNAIGSSCSHVRTKVADGKENSKRKANPVSTVQRSNK